MWGYELIVQRGINWRHGAVCFTTEEEILEVNASQNLQPTQRKTSADSLIASFYYFFASLPFTFFFQHGKTTSFSIYKTFPPLCLTCLIWSTPPSVSFQAHLAALITMYAICFGLNVFDNFILESSLNCFIDY